MNGGIRLGVVRGVEIVADVSASVLAILFGAAVFVELTSRDLTSSTERALALAAIAGVLVVVSVIIHEFAHAAVAKWKGFRVLGVRVFMFGGYSIIEGDNDPMSEFHVAVAGPTASIGLGLMLWAAAMAAGMDGDIGATARALEIANVAVGLFNLFPGFPLDGGRVVRGLIAARTGDRLAATKACRWPSPVTRHRIRRYGRKTMRASSWPERPRSSRSFTAARAFWLFRVCTTRRSTLWPRRP